ncbi:MAG: ROK family protein [Deltaproteobacteria bacterium]
MGIPSIGIDLGGSKIEGILLDGDGKIVCRERLPTEQSKGYEHILSRITTLVRKLEAGSPGLPVGIGTPGSLSARDGTLKNSNTQCLNGRAIHTDLENRLGRRLRIENDANCFALAEARLGAGRGARMVFGVILGTGVGGGIVIDGRIWSGPQHIAGEWGHHIIDPAGPRCYCGATGCIESLLSGPALAARYAAAGGATLDAAQIAQRAAAGEALASRLLNEWLDLFGRALANLITILDPEIIVLGGGLSNIDGLYDRGRARVAHYIFNDELTTPIRRHQIGDSAGVLGAALLASAATTR